MYRYYSANPRTKNQKSTSDRNRCTDVIRQIQEQKIRRSVSSRDCAKTNASETYCAHLPTSGKPYHGSALRLSFQKALTFGKMKQISTDDECLCQSCRGVDRCQCQNPWLHQLSILLTDVEVFQLRLWRIEVLRGQKHEWANEPIRIHRGGSTSQSHELKP